MKRNIPALTSLVATSVLFFTNVNLALAQTQQIDIHPVKQGIDPNTPVGTILSNAISIIFVVAILLVLVFLIIGAFNWITSGGDKERVGKARGMILNALIGLAVLALAFVLFTIVGRVVNVNTSNLTLPSLNTPN